MLTDTALTHSVKTILRWINELYASVDVGGFGTYNNTTLNTKYGVQTTMTPIDVPKLKYFGLGIRGFYNLDDTNLAQAYKPKATDMDLYTPIPIRCVPVSEDLNAVERAQYRMRVKQNFKGQDYFCYYLKVLTNIDNLVNLTTTDADGKEVPYTLSTANLNPIPEVAKTSGEVLGSPNTVNATFKLSANYLGHEIYEGINAIYGDLRYAKISEYGIYSGVDMTVTGYDSVNQPFEYTEAIYTQLAYKFCTLGSVVETPDYNGTKTFVLGNGNTLLLDS